MVKIKKTFSLFFAVLMVAFCLPVSGNAVDETVILYADIAIETPRLGEKFADTILNASFDSYTAELTGWYDSDHNPLSAEQLTYEENKEYIMAFTLTADEGYTFSDPLEEVTVNGRDAREVADGTSTIRYYEVTLFAIPANMINLVEISIKPFPGLTVMDYAMLISIDTEHVSFSEDTKQNGVKMVNETDETDTSGITKSDNVYKISFALSADEGYMFYPGGGTIGISGAVGIDRIVEIGESNKTIYEFSIWIYVPNYSIDNINVIYDEENGADNFSKLFVSNTDYVSIKNLRVTKGGTQVNKLTPGDYKMDFTLVADTGFTIVESPTVTVDNITDFTYGETYVDQATGQYCIDVTCNVTVAIKYISVKFNPQNDYSKLIVPQTDNILITNIKVLDSKGNEVSRVTGGNYTITYTAVADEGYVISDNVRIFAVDRYTLHSDPYVYDEATGQMAVDSSLDVKVKSNNFFQQLLDILSAIPKAIISFFRNLFK